LASGRIMPGKLQRESGAQHPASGRGFEGGVHGAVTDFSVDDSSGQVVVKVIDGESGKLIRQIPSEELLRLSERLEDMRSLLFKAQA